MNSFIKLTGRKFKDEILLPVDKIGPMYNCKGDKADYEDDYTVIVCDGLIYKVLETKEEIMKRMGAYVL